MNEQKGWAGLALVIFSCLRADKQLYLAMWQPGSLAVWLPPLQTCHKAARKNIISRVPAPVSAPFQIRTSFHSWQNILSCSINTTLNHYEYRDNMHAKRRCNVHSVGIILSRGECRHILFSNSGGRAQLKTFLPLLLNSSFSTDRCRKIFSHIIRELNDT